VIALEYDESARLLRGLLAGLVRDGEACGAVMEQYLALFAQHSGRCWLPSLAALLDASSSDLDYLGRWRPTPAKTYVRTALQVVARMQVRVAERVRHELADGQAELLGESAAYLELRRELLRRGNDLRQIEQQEGLFRAWTAKVLYPPAQGAEAPAWEEDELDLEAADEASDATPIDFEPARGPEEHRAPEERGRGAGGEQLPVEVIALEYNEKDAPTNIEPHTFPGSRGRRRGTRLLVQSRIQAAAGTFLSGPLCSWLRVGAEVSGAALAPSKYLEVLSAAARTEVAARLAYYRTPPSIERRKRYKGGGGGKRLGRYSLQPLQGRHGPWGQGRHGPCPP